MPNKQGQLIKGQYISERNVVGVEILKTSIFKNELVSNGILNSPQKGILKFSINGELDNLNFKNGEWVKENQLIAQLKQEELKQSLEQAQISLAKARLELQDMLIGQNYNTNDTLNIPKEVYDVLKIRSGYSEALNSVKKAELNLKNSELRAPFSGTIANLKYKLYEQVSTGEEFCTLIDNTIFEVSFSILETELKNISLGKDLKVTPFSNNETSYTGKITEINPVIDENGLIQVKARLNNTDGLIEGMNVKVYVETEIPSQLVVPRSAVVLRQNQEVLFKYVSGIAFWTYVKVLYENSSSYAVIAHPEKGGTLMPGDTIIVSENLNLAHESEVEIQ